MISKIFIITLVVGIASAKTIIGQLPPKPAALADKEGCYIKEINDVIPFGDSVVPLDSCHRIYCGRVLFYASCRTIETDDPTCHIADGDLSRPYPHCCPHLKCDAHDDFIPLI
ncbi:uncharacterized protein LOC126910766 isoform X3 [Spodoptera frugiperda]|uniref:Uncharacterized protein LOC126910766 isoform X3 n=1 Tax=Spodoptera frugiperda TaxID=7108 RepID=A0A9R0EW32_SPOFR|nr:uncharacterized protein LOC126910766 isoform X3 [Spodoptera frugiperda]